MFVVNFESNKKLLCKIIELNSLNKSRVIINMFDRQLLFGCQWDDYVFYII